MSYMLESLAQSLIKSVPVTELGGFSLSLDQNIHILVCIIIVSM